ncbi:Hypothetical protein POVR2_LOCUS247 [uncultured virus]|nr:Hypothetical protein POVR2_LOCUS247 [uncultured virus]
MNNPDTLRKLAMSMDYQALVNLARESQWIREVTKLFGDRTFWKQKTEYVAEMTLPEILDADWAQIYHRVVEFMKRRQSNDNESILAHTYELALGDLATLQVFLAIQPARKLTIESDEDDLLKIDGFKVRSLPVLLWLFDNKYIPYHEDLLELILMSAIKTNSIEIVKYCLANIKNVDLAIALNRALHKDRFEVFSYLVDFFKSPLLAREVLTSIAIRAKSSKYLELALAKYADILEVADILAAVDGTYRNNSISASEDMLRALLVYLQSNFQVDNYSEKLFNLAIERDNENGLRLLLELYPQHQQVVTWDLLMQCVKKTYANVIPVILEYVDPSLHDNEALYTAVLTLYSIRVIYALLADARVDPAQVLTRLYALERPAYNLRSKIVELLTSDRLDIDTLDSHTIDGIVSTIGSEWNNKEGYVEGARASMKYLNRLDMTTVNTEIASVISGPKTLYSRTLGYLIIKLQDNNRSYLFDWMIEQNKLEFALAANNVLSGFQATSWIEGMMLLGLHKSMTLKDVVNELRATSTEEELVRAAKILGVYLGEKEIRRRDKTASVSK